MIGSLLDGRYRIERQLGAGGFGEVYLADNIKLGRQEALKVLHANFADDPELISRFRREARAMNRLSHMNIVDVLDFGKLSDGRFYLAMELIDGVPLDRILHDIGFLPVARALNIIWQLASAVDHAHSHGVVHRDLKPENMILIEHRGQVDVLKVLDFGSAKIVAPDYNESRGITRDGDVFGTAAYMAPEQCLGLPTDPRCDFYAIGCIAYELLCGDPPFGGRPMDLMHAQIGETPDLPSARWPRANIPPELDEIVMRCLEKNPESRFQSGAELALALTKIPGFPRAGRKRTTLSEMQGRPDRQRTPVTTPRPAEGQAEATQDLELELRAAIGALADMLLDLGQSDVKLIVGVADLKELQEELSREEREIETLEASTTALEQSARERQNVLRFAIGELRFSATETGALESAETEAEIRVLDERIATLSANFERDLSLAMDHLLSMTASHSTTEDRVRAAYAKFEPIVTGLAARLERYERVAKKLDEIAVLHDQLRQATPMDPREWTQ